MSSLTTLAGYKAVVYFIHWCVILSAQSAKATSENTCHKPQLSRKCCRDMSDGITFVSH
jgi:hypothetical protein